VLVQPVHKILIAHNAYQQRGGEDSVVESEIALLRARGHTVVEYRRSNDDLKNMGRLGAATQTLWSRQTKAELAALFAAEKPDVLHVHNTFPLISPSLYWAAAEAHVPVVQTLHNYRLLCPQAMLLREGSVCEDCVGKVPWRAAVRACYRESTLQSAVLSGMLTLHRGLGTYQKKIGRYIALTDFGRQKFIDGGLPAERIRVKPNFVESPAENANSEREGFLFVGRLSAEKGIDVLAQALKSAPNLLCEVIGAGPDEACLTQLSGVTLSGWQQGDYILSRMQATRALVMPSICFEGFPRTLAEAFAAGLPVIASRLGAMATSIDHGRTGLLFEPGNPTDLAEKLRWAQENPEAMATMGRAARAEYEARYTPEKNYELLMDIYAEAIDVSQQGV
jgi:glycosyltransferase involved in cell wall biosynthesis